MSITLPRRDPPLPSPASGDLVGGLPWDDPEWFRDLDRAEKQCRDYLEALRWPEGVGCPRCASNETARLVTRKRFWCRDCKYQFSVTAGTLFHNSHTPVWKWFLAVQLLVESDGGLPANQLVRQLGGSYKTAWFIEHRVRAALKESQGSHLHCGSNSSEKSPSEVERVYDRAVVGCYHQHSLKHLDAYRAEKQWLATNAENPHRFRDTVVALLQGEPLEYNQLVGPNALRGVAASSPTPA